MKWLFDARETGTVSVVKLGHECDFSGVIGRGLPLGTTAECTCGKKYVLEEEKKGADWSFKYERVWNEVTEDGSKSVTITVPSEYWDRLSKLKKQQPHEESWEHDMTFAALKVLQTYTAVRVVDSIRWEDGGL